MQHSLVARWQLDAAENDLPNEPLEFGIVGKVDARSSRTLCYLSVIDVDPPKPLLLREDPRYDEST